MSTPIVFQTGVREEIDEAYAWYEAQQRGLGEAFLEAVQDVLDRIGRVPEIHATIFRSVRRGRVKRFTYSVYYRVEPQRIVVVAVHHDRRDPKHWQSRS